MFSYPLFRKQTFPDCYNFPKVFSLCSSLKRTEEPSHSRGGHSTCEWSGTPRCRCHHFAGHLLRTLCHGIWHSAFVQSLPIPHYFSLILDITQAQTQDLRSELYYSGRSGAFHYFQPATDRVSSQHSLCLAAWNYLYLGLGLKSVLAERRTQRLQRGSFQMCSVCPPNYLKI